MRRQKTLEELRNDLNQVNPAGLSIQKQRFRNDINNGNISKLQELANKYNIPLERDATPRPTRGEPIRTWEETGPVKTLEDANHVLKAKNIHAATTLQQGLNDIKRYHLPNEITKVHTEYGPNDIDIKPIPVKLPERTSRSAQQSPISNTGGGAERDIPRNRDESPASANVRIAIRNASEGKNDPRFNEALSKLSAQQRLRASTAIPKHKYEEDIPARSYRGMENSEEPAEIGNVNVYRSVKEDKSKEKSAIDDIFNKQNNLDIDSDVLQTEHGPKFYQKLLRGTYKQAAKAYGGDPFVYQGSAFVNPSELETIARGRVQEISPFSQQEEERNQALNDIILSYANDQTAQESIKPYLAELSKNPARHHKELMGDVESNMEDTITNRANRNFLEKVLPTIRSKYQTPGLLQHGHMGKDIGEAVEKHGRGVAEELSKAKLGMRNITLNASQRHAQQQGEAAGISQQAAIKDRQNNLDAINALQIADKQRKAEKGAYVGNLERLGKQDTDLAQRHRNYEIELAHRIHEHPKTQVEGLASVLKGVPQPYKATGITGKGPARPETTEGQLWTGAGNMLAGAGAYMMPRPAKKGGRIHKAVGGQVDPMQDVIQNAVIDRRDPVTELRQMIQHARGVQALQGRQQLKIGGSVDPIQAGATDANLYAGHSSMKNKLERLRRPQEGKSPAGFMSAMAAASKDTKGWLGDIMRAYGSADEQINKEKSEHRNRINSADDLEYALQEKLKDRAQKEREMAAKDKMDAETISHIRAQNSLLGLQGKKLQYEMSGTAQPNYLVEDFMGEDKPVANNESSKTTAIPAEQPSGALKTLDLSEKSSRKPLPENGSNTGLSAPAGIAAKTTESSKVPQESNTLMNIPRIKQDKDDKKTTEESIDDFELADKILTDCVGAFDSFSKIEGNQILSGINKIAGNHVASFAGKLVGRKFSPKDVQSAETKGHSLYGSLQSAEKAPGRIRASVESALTAKPSSDKEQEINLSEIIKHSERAINVQKKDIQSMLDARANPRLIQQKINRLKNGMRQVDEMKQKYRTLFPVALENLNPNDISKMSDEQLMSLS